MAFEIIGSVDVNRMYGTGSFTKLLTTFVVLSRLAEDYRVEDIIDDDNFLDQICINSQAKSFLAIFQQHIGSQFTIHDLCTYYAGLPYTFDLTAAELESVDAGQPFKHHHILDENTFLTMCRDNVTQVYANRCKFHYSEIAIICLGYLLEKIYDLKIETLFQKYIIKQFGLKSSVFTRTQAKEAYYQDLSLKYDYPAVAKADYGYFCYSNGFFTTLYDMKILLENLFHAPIFQYMINLHYARAASPRLMNGLTIEIRRVKDDFIYGYEGLSFSGSNIWAYSTKHKKGYLTTTDSEEKSYDVIYQPFGYTEFDKVPEETERFYRRFIKHYDFNQYEKKDIPLEYRGEYHRVNINEATLTETFLVEKNNIIIRNPERIRFEIIYLNNVYRIKGKDNVHGSKVGFYQAKSGNRYMFFDGNLYRKY